jgi:hypothetical protein
MKVTIESVRTTASYYGYGPQREGQSDDDYRTEVALKLRQEGKLIEAHEIAQGRRYEADDGSFDPGVMLGVIGATHEALNGERPWSNRGDAVFGDDIAAGGIVSQPDPHAALRQAFDMLGPEVAMDLWTKGFGAR